jgi:filamentous hemagglutinin family protein
MSTGGRSGAARQATQAKHHPQARHDLRRAPIARAIAMALAAGGLFGTAHAQRAFSAGWMAQKNMAQNTAIATGRLPNGMPASSLTSTQAQQQQANAQLQRSIGNLNLAAQAIAAQQGAQAAARQAAANDPTSVPDGLADGGLKVDTDSLTAGWLNANAPVQTVSNGRTNVAIRQTADRAILNWETFNVGRQTTVEFQQQSAWSVLNKVNDPQARPSQIQGQIKADGTVMIANRNGIVFSGSSQVDVRNLVAAAARITDNQFTSGGLYGASVATPTFTDALGKVEVQAGAKITTTEPRSVTDGGGYVMLLGTEVSNAGEIATRKGQALLAAGDSFLIRKGVGTDGNTFSTTRGSEVAPQFVADSTAGKVVNSGLLLAREGDITLTGRDLRQNGVAVATTTVNTRGTVHLLTSANDDKGTVRMGEGAVTAIVTEDDGKTTALDSQRDALIKDSAALDQLRALAAATSGRNFDNLSTLTDRRDLSRIEIVGGSAVDFEGGSLTLATGGQLAVSAGNAAAGTREDVATTTPATFGAIRVRSGAQLDVSGSVGVRVAMESNDVKVNVQGNELRDAPLNRDAGKLFNRDLWVDRRRLVRVPAAAGVYDSDRWYTAGGLLEVSGYLGNQGHGIGEWTAQGGIVNLAGDSTVTAAGSSINLSGGTLDVQTGSIHNTWLKGSDGRLYTANNAPADLVYSGVYVGYEDKHARWGVTDSFFNPLIAPQRQMENGYTVGRDAGSLVIASANALLDGDIEARVYNGPRQTDTRPLTVSDAYKLSQTQAALPARLVIQSYDPTLKTDGASPRLQSISDVRIDNERPSDEQLPSAIAKTGNLVWMNRDRLNDAGLGGLKTVAFGDLTIGGDLALAPGGAMDFTTSGNVTLDGSLSARGGSVSLVGGTGLFGDLHGLTVQRGIVIDTRGLWTNAALDPASAWGAAFRNGGTVTLVTNGALQLESGSRIDASAGAALLSNGSVLDGAGGDVSLSAGGLVIDGGGTIASYGFTRGGKLSIVTPAAISIGGTLLATRGLLAPGEAAPFDLTVGADFVLPAGTTLPFELKVSSGDFIRLGAVVPPDAIVNIPFNKPVTVGPNGWTTPIDGVYARDPVTGVQTAYAAGSLVPAGYLVVTIQNSFPTGYVMPADAFTAPLPIYRRTTTYAAGTVLAMDLDVIAGTALQRGAVLPVAASVMPVFEVTDAQAFFQQGFSAYNLSGAAGAVVKPGTRVDVAMPIYRLTGASLGSGAPQQSLAGDALAEAAQLYLPPLFTENALKGTLKQRAGADLSLTGGIPNSVAGAVANPLVSGGIVIGEGAVVSVDPGRRIDLTSKGQITVDGSFVAPGGAISIVNTRTLDDVAAAWRIAHPNEWNYEDNDPADAMSVWIGEHAVLDVAGRAYTALDAQGRTYGTVLDGGAIVLGSLGGKNPLASGVMSSSSYVVVRPGARIDASGASAVLDVAAGSVGAAGPARAPRTVASDGGSITISSYQSFFLDGELRAAAGGAGASGGSLSLVLESPVYGGPFGIDPLTRPGRVIMVAQDDRPGSLAADLAPGALDDGFVVGTARVSAAQVARGGFDSLSLWARSGLFFDGDVDLRLGRSLALQQGLIYQTTAGANVRLAAPYLLFDGGIQMVGRSPSSQVPLVGGARLPDHETGGSFTAESDLIDLRNAVRMQFDRTLLQSSGDLRFLAGTASAPEAQLNDSSGRTTELRAWGDLELAAAQVYPVSGAVAVARAGAGKAPDATTSSVLSIRSTGDVPAQPYSVLGSLTLNADVIRQGGVLRAPFGSLTLNATREVELLDGSVTSVGTSGLAMPFGGTVDGVNYTVNGVDVLKPALGSGQFGGVFTKDELGINGQVGLRINAASLVGDAGSLLDLSGGGQLLGAAFVTGRGGSVDTLLSPLKAGGKVYAIVPGAKTAPVPGGYNAAWTGAAPGIGQQITIPDGVPGLAGGTYTLMPANYALLPGAFRVELGGAVQEFAGALPLRNGSYALTGVQGIANTAIRDSLGTMVTVTPGATLRTYSSYNEQGYDQFQFARANTFGTLRPQLEIDGKQLIFNARVAPDNANASALVFNGRADFSAARGGYPGAFSLLGGVYSDPAGTNLVITADGSATRNDATTIAVAASEIGKLQAPNLYIGGMPNVTTPNIALQGVIGNEGLMAKNLVLERGVTLTGGQVVLGAAGKITLEEGASISTLGQGTSWLDSRSGLLFGPKASPFGSTAILLVSNGTFTLDAPSGLYGSNIELKDGVALYSEGTVGFYSDLGVSLVGTPKIGTRNLSLAVPSFNIGTAAALAAVAQLPAGMSLDQGILDTLFAGNRAAGVPAIENLVLSAGKSINFFGTVDLDTIDPATGKSHLKQLVFNSPAIYGYGAAGDTVRLSTDTLVWNDTFTKVINDNASRPLYGSAAPGAVMAGGPGSGRFEVNANSIVFGYPTPAQPDSSVRFDRLMLGFSDVALNASERIVGNANGTVSIYQNGADPSTAFDPATYAGTGATVRLNTPLFTAESGAVLGLYAGGALSVTAPDGATASTDKVGGQIDLHAGRIDIASAIVLPTGKLTLTAEGDITLAAGSRLDVSGRSLAFFDQVRNTWGGDIVIESRHGNVLQAQGSTIDVSAAHEDAGTLRVSALNDGADARPDAGAVRLDGTLRGSGAQGHASGGIDLRAQRIGDSAATLTSDFAALNTRLTEAGFLGSRGFAFKQGNLEIGDELKARDVTVSVDDGSLTVKGRIDASGERPGSIRLAARDDLRLAGGAVLDAHGTALQVDSYGQPIEALNRGAIELTSAQGWLRLDDGTTLDVSAPGVNFGRVVLNARRATETGGDILVDASGQVNVHGAASIAVNGFWTYAPTDAAGTIVRDTGADNVPAGAVGLNQIDAKSQVFYANALANGALQGRLAGLKAYGEAYHLRPGVEIVSSEASGGKLKIASDIDLADYRYGRGEPMALTVRAAGDLDIKGSITDGFGKPKGSPDDFTVLLLAGAKLNADYVLPENATLAVGTTLGVGVTLPFNIELHDGEVLRAGEATPRQIVLHPAYDPNVGANVYYFGGANSWGEMLEPVQVVSGRVDDWNWNGTSFGPGSYIAYGLGDGAVIYPGTVFRSATAGYADVVLAPPPQVAAGKSLPQAVTLAAGYTLSAALTATGTIATPTRTWTAGMTIPAGTVLPSGTTLGTGASLPFDFDIAATTWQAGNPLVLVGGYTLTASMDLPAGTVLPTGTVVSTTADVLSMRSRPLWALAPMLAAGSPSASIRLVGGADLAAADTRALRPASALRGAGNITLDDSRLSGLTQKPIFSVIRTGTGDLDILAGGDFSQATPFGVYTAGTQSELPEGNAAFELQRAKLTGVAAYDAALNDRSTWFPDHGGDLYIAAQGNLTDWGPLRDDKTTSIASWLWTQGGDGMGQQPAWSINFGTYVQTGTRYNPATGRSDALIGVSGFDGFGALGGGNVTLRVDGHAGVLEAYDPNGLDVGTRPAGGLTVAVGATGRVTSVTTRDGVVTGGTLVQTGGGDLRLKIGGALNPAPAADRRALADEMNGTFADLRGDIAIDAGSIGSLQLAYGVKGSQDPRGVGLYTASLAGSAGGPAIVPGDGTASFRTRGDLVLGGYGDATMLDPGTVGNYQFNYTVLGALASDPTKVGVGRSWFSLWTPRTAVSLFAAGGNLAPFWGQGTSVNEQGYGGIYGIALMPAQFRAVAGSGSIYYGSQQSNAPTTYELTPSAGGQLELLAADSIYASGAGEATALVGMSGARAGVDALPNPFKPAWLLVAPNFTSNIVTLTIDGINGYGTNTLVRIAPPPFVGGPTTYSPTLGYFAFQPADTPAGVLHAGDTEPIRLYAVDGDIVGATLGASQPASTFGAPRPATYLAAKAAQVRAGRDIVGFGLGNANDPLGAPSVIMNANDTDVSSIEAGRDIFYANARIAGPGTLEVAAGRNIYQGDKGTIVSIGQVVPGDNRAGADVVLQAGTGVGGPAYAGLMKYLDPANLLPEGTALAGSGKVVKTYEQELAEWLKKTHGFGGSPAEALAYFGTLAPEQQHTFLRTVYFAELRAGGREYNDEASKRYGSYLRGRDAIAALFPKLDAEGNAIERDGDITLFGGSGVRTLFGGSIELLAPGGQVVVGVQGQVPPSTAGIVTQGAGDIGIFSQGSILLGLSRIMTTFGGGILAWSEEGDINAGRGSKTTLVYTPPKREYDTLGNVKLSPNVPSTGAGIATLDPIPEVPPGDVDLIAPLGTIDAGEAGIRVSGNVNLAALQVVNAANIQVKGESKGLPVVASVNVGALTNASAAASQAAMAAQDTVQRERATARQALPSVFTVRVLGFGNEPAGTSPGDEKKPTPQTGSLSSSAPTGPDARIPVQVLGHGGGFDASVLSMLSNEERRLLRQGR